MEVLAIIPARCGSKSIISKNIRLFNGKPLLAHSIDHAKQSRLINRIIVSTDSIEYQEIAKRYGAETPFLRPIDISGDLSTDLEVFDHALNWLKRKDNYIPELIVHLRPTTPIRQSIDIDNCIEILINNAQIDSVRSVVKAPNTPFKMWFKEDRGLIKPVIIDKKNSESHSSPRQLLQPVYLQNASIDVVRYKTIIDKHSMVGDLCYGYVMNKNIDIDYGYQWNSAEIQSKLNEKSPKTYCFDIDGILANLVPDNAYDKATPIIENIDLVNKLHNEGNKIILYTARGSKTGIDWSGLTKRQLSKWNVKYHELDIGKKPAADFYVDDRFIDLEFLRNINKEKLNE